MRWRREVLAYWQTRATNGMTEGFNGKAKRQEPPNEGAGPSFVVC
jgi:transposase